MIKSNNLMPLLLIIFLTGDCSYFAETSNSSTHQILSYDISKTSGQNLSSFLTLSNSSIQETKNSSLSSTSYYGEHQAMEKLANKQKEQKRYTLKDIIAKMELM